VSTPPAQVPEWATGDVTSLHAYVRAHSVDQAGVEGLIGALRRALPVWRTDTARFAEHFGFFADFLLVTGVPVTGDLGLLDSAVALQEEGAAAPGKSGQVAYRLEFLGRQLDVAVAAREAGQAAMAAHIASHCSAVQDRLVGMAPVQLRDVVWQAVRWMDLAAGVQEWPAAATAGDLAAKALWNLLAVVDLNQMLATLASFSGVPADAAGALLRAGRAADAAAIIEIGRQHIARGWREAGDAAAALRDDNQQLLTRFFGETEAWRSAADEALSETNQDQRERAEERAGAALARVAETIARIRQQPGLGRFQVLPSFAEILEAASDSPVCYVWSSRHGTAALLVLPGGNMVNIILTDLTSARITEIVSRWTSLLSPGQESTSTDREVALTDTTGDLRPSIVRLLREVLTRPAQAKPSYQGWRWGTVTLIVTGPLSYLPLHCWTPYARESDGTTHHMPLAYAPSVRQAIRARRPPRSVTPRRRLLSLADPWPRPAGRSPLPCARLESVLIAETAHEARLLHGTDATASAFLELATGYEVLHLACHGMTGRDRPGGAYFEVAGGTLAAAEIFDRGELNASLVVLSACRSGQPDGLLPAEALDAASMFLSAGARAVVSTMWPVDDLAATLFTCRLFQIWNWGEGMILPQAVHYARLWLRDITVGQLRGLALAEPRLAPHISRYTRFQPPDLARFGEPYYWAPFAYSGA
jgi:CHAT domain-containing protein